MSSSSCSSDVDDVVPLESDRDEGVAPLESDGVDEKLNPEEISVDQFVIILFNDEKYPGRVLKITKEGPVVDCMEKKLLCWKWPPKKDTGLYEWKNVLRKIHPPKLTKRNQYLVPELNNFV